MTHRCVRTLRRYHIQQPIRHQPDVMTGSMVSASLLMKCRMAAIGMVQFSVAPTVPTMRVQRSERKYEEEEEDDESEDDDEEDDDEEPDECD